VREGIQVCKLSSHQPAREKEDSHRIFQTHQLPLLLCSRQQQDAHEQRSVRCRARTRTLLIKQGNVKRELKNTTFSCKPSKENDFFFSPTLTSSKKK